MTAKHNQHRKGATSAEAAEQVDSTSPEGTPQPQAEAQGTAEGDPKDPTAAQNAGVGTGGADAEGVASSDSEATAQADAPTPEDLAAKVAQLEDRLLRARADYQNLQRRSEQDRQDAIRYGNAELLRNLLPVLDDFDRSLGAAQEVQDVASLVQGVELMRDNFFKTLTQHGLEPIEAEGQAFDPRSHEALLQRPAADREAGTVLEVITKGYKLRDRLLRAAQVIVAQAPPEQAGEVSEGGMNQGDAPPARPSGDEAGPAGEIDQTV
jgi:molecular chaperone GrpE